MWYLSSHYFNFLGLQNTLTDEHIFTNRFNQTQMIKLFNRCACQYSNITKHRC